MIDKTLLRQVASLVFYPQNQDTAGILSQIEVLVQKQERYVNAEFRELGIQYATEQQKLKKNLEQIERAKAAQEIIDKGYLVIQDPEWDHYYGRTRFQWGDKFKDRLHKSHSNGLVPVRKINRTPRLFSNIENERVLACVPTNRFKSNVPEFVIERVIEEKEKGLFSSYDIFFVAKLGDIDKMVREFVVDPILVGRWSVGSRLRDFGFAMPHLMRAEDMTEEEVKQWYDEHYYEPIPSKQGAVLAMWGTDLEEIDIALLSSQHRPLDSTPIKVNKDA